MTLFLEQLPAAAVTIPRYVLWAGGRHSIMFYIRDNISRTVQRASGIELLKRWRNMRGGMVSCDADYGSCVFIMGFHGYSVLLTVRAKPVMFVCERMARARAF